jgi:hypothetical protein
MPADAVMPISVVVERRTAAGPWRDDQWRPIGVLPADVAAERGRLLAEGEGWAQYQGGTLEIELFRGETEGYLTNLSQKPPRVFVVLRRNEEGEGLSYTPFLATVCPYEAMSYNEGNDDVVDGVPMPLGVMAWVQDFVARHHVDVPFKKREHRRHDDDFGAAQPLTDDERSMP